MTEHNIGLAFGLCGLACLFSILGSCAPFLDLFPIFSFKIADSHLVLAGSLSLTCGILIFLSLVDIFPDAVSKFASSELVDPIHAKILTLGFFCVGILTMMFSNHKQEKINLDSSDKSPEDTLTDIKDHHVSHDVFSMVAALSLHNLPEGILLYVATVSEESVGIALSIGLIFHKFPEGLVVAMPLYCLRKSMVLAFAVSMVSPIFFMIGAIIGYAVTQNIAYDSFVNGVLMSFATGILFWISISGIMPLSRRLDPLNKVCDVCFLIGLGIVLVSLSILSYAE